MPVERTKGLLQPGPLAGRLSDGADAGQIADTIVAVWKEIDQALNPIIGFRGVAALYNRSLKLTAATHPWLPGRHEDALVALDVTALRAALVQQTAAEALAGGIALFHSFHDLLASLIGSALTDQLLQSIWAQPAVASPAQDNTQ